MTNDADERSADAASPVSASKDEETMGSPSVSTAVSSSAPRALTPADLPPGTVVDKYRLGSILGQGGMGLVVAAEHVQLRERVALKFLRVDGDEGQGFRARFRREAQICAQIKNEHITRVIDIGSYKDADYMVMEYLSGIDLRGFVKQTPALELETAVDFALQICEGLAEVHARGVVHRDLKPSNLFVTPRSDGTHLLKILDFGISKWASEMDAEEEELTKTGAVLGSPKYMAPEQLFGSSTVDARADVWSVGAILYEMLTGKPPFEEPSFARLCVRISSGEPPQRPRERRPEIPEELDAAVMLCLEPNLVHRLPTVAALAGEILAAMRDPLAETARERLQAVLDGGSSAAGGAASGPISLMRSGSYVAASMTLSRPGGSTTRRPSAPTTAGVSASVDEAEPVAPASQGQRRIALVVMALVAVIAIFFLTRSTLEPTPTTAVGVDKPAVPPTVTAPPIASVIPPVSAVSTATSASPSVSAAAVKLVALPKLAAKATAKIAEPAPTPAPTPVAAPAPTPSPVAKEPTKPNPLEDRQ